jgi:hypothetical protein
LSLREKTTKDYRIGSPHERLSYSCLTPHGWTTSPGKSSHFCTTLSKAQLTFHRPRLRDRLIGNGQNFLNFDAFFIPFTTTISINWPYNPNDCLLPASKVNLPASSTGSLAASSPYSTAVNAGSPAPPLTPQPIVGTPGTVNSASGADEQYLINPAFESHLRNLNNWSLGPDFRAQFPNLSGAVRIKEGR